MKIKLSDRTHVNEKREKENRKHLAKNDVQAVAQLYDLNFKIQQNHIPKVIEFRDELPKTVVGKLSKKELIAEEKAKKELMKRAQ